MTVTPAGDVGFGTTSPVREVEIKGGGTSGTQLQVTGSANSAGIKFVPASGADEFEIQANVGSEWFVYNRTDNQYVLQIDGSGRVTTPYQPNFRGYQVGGWSGNGTVMQFGSIKSNIGSCWNTSTHRFTAPVAGVYLVNAGFIAESQTSNDEHNVILNKNGTVVTDTRFLGHGKDTGNISIAVEMNANDYLQLFIGNPNTYIYSGNTQRYNTLSITLLG